MKKGRIRKRDFIKQRKALQKLTLLLFCFVLILAHLVVFSSVSGKPFTLANASQVVGLSQSISPPQMIEKTEALIVQEKKAKKINSVDFRIITPIGENFSDNPPTVEEMFKTTPIVTFSGVSLYPNSQVFLNVHSDPFISSTLSDNQGRWNWANYANPLEPGEHMLEAYSISPVEIAGKRDVFAQKYFFMVTEDKSINPSNFVSLGDSNYKEQGGGDDLDDRINQDRIDNTYVFSVVLPDKIDYGFGDTMNVELLFSPLGNGKKNQAVIEYSIFAIDEAGNIDSLAAAEFSDKADLNDGGYFLKRIKLKDSLMPGEYAMKIMAKIGDDKYYQSFKFNISAKALMTIGSNVVTVEKFGQAVVFNILLIVIIFIVLILLVIVEFRRYMVHGSIDENFLRGKGCITK